IQAGPPSNHCGGRAFSNESVSQRYLTGRARKCGSAGCVLTMARLRHPVMKHRGDVIDLEVNSPQIPIKLGGRGPTEGPFML
ncbi:P43 5S RNA-binding protein, partial [Dissostichus eleginoides]